MLHYITKYNLKHLGWHHVDDALLMIDESLKTNNPIIMGLYAFAVCEDKPHDNLWPWEVQSVVDIGKAGGGEGVRADYKNRANSSPKIRTALDDRIRSHKTSYTPQISKVDDVKDHIQSIRKLFLDDPSNELWVGILHYETPITDFTKINLVKGMSAELYLCEAEGITEYKNNWGNVPIGNPGHSDTSKTTKRKTQKKKKSLSESHFSQPNLAYFL